MWNQVDGEFSKIMGVESGSAESLQVAATPAGRLSTPEEYVGAAVFLASPESSYVVGQTFNIDGDLNLS